MIGGASSLRFYIRPKQELLDLIQGHQSLLTELLEQTWECDIERSGRSIWSLEDYTAQAKLALLARETKRAIESNFR